MRGLSEVQKGEKKRSKENWWTRKDAGVFPKRAVIYRRSRQLRLLLTFVLKRAIHVRSNWRAEMSEIAQIHRAVDEDARFRYIAPVRRRLVFGIGNSPPELYNPFLLLFCLAPDNAFQMGRLPHIRGSLKYCNTSFVFFLGWSFTFNLCFHSTALQGCACWAEKVWWSPVLWNRGRSLEEPSLTLDLIIAPFVFFSSSDDQN